MEKSWGYCKNKTKTISRRLKSKSWEHQRTPDSREHKSTGAHQMPPYLHWNQVPPKGQQVPEQDIPHKFSSNRWTQPWASIYRLPKVTPDPLTFHNSLLDTSLYSREKKSSSTHQNTDTSFPNQETLTSHLYNPTTVRNLHNKEEPQTARIRKGNPKHSNINKMKRQINTQLVKNTIKAQQRKQKRRR